MDSTRIYLLASQVLGSPTIRHQIAKEISALLSSSRQLYLHAMANVDLQLRFTT